MSSQPDRPLRIELTVSASQPNLLQGLDVWLSLGLISHTQVKRLSQQYLTCRLPQLEVAPSPPVLQVASRRKIETPVVPISNPSLASQMWQSFQDELSVRWLLFLGVFLVVASSGVLAATQWRNFPPAGQYGVLWGYTVIFFGISIWAGKQPNLQLTTQTLQLVSLLLVPVNFWAIDSFGLWRNPAEWGVVGVAAFTLTAITILNQSMRDDSSHLTSRASLILWLSYLHWGWHWSIFPLVAVYLGVIGTAILLPKRRLPGMGREGERDSLHRILPNAPTGSSIVIYTLTVLLARGIFVVHLPIEELGFAIGICGWLLARLGKPPETLPESASSFGSQLWDGIGGSLLLIGWLVSVQEGFPWQATAVSGLSLSFFSQRLQYSWRRIDLFAIFVIGLQTLFLVWRLIPSALQQSAIAILTQLTGSSDALPSLALFPYIILWVGVTDWLYRKSSEGRFHETSLHEDVSLRRLAYFGEWLTLGLGVVLTLISTLNPITRSLNLLLSTITLIIVTHRRIPIRVSLVYLTHSIGLLTLCSTIDTLLPNLSKPVWAAILLTVMVGEWGVGSGGNLASSSPSSQRLNNPTSQSIGVRSTSVPTRLIAAPIWYRSCWYIGFLLAGLSYILLWDETFTYSFTIPSTPQQWRLLWLLTPLTLTGVASRTGESRRKEASWWSVIALIMVQVLTFSFPGVRLISLAFATGLMGLNTRYLKELSAALITIGFALSYVGMLLWDGIPGLPKVSAPDWFLVGAIAMTSLWLLRRLLIQRPGTLTALYAQASDYWAIALCSVELLILSLHSLASYQEFTDASWQHLTASILIGSTILYRSWQQPTDAGVYAISWAVEITVAESILLLNGSTLTLAIANIILAILTLFLTDLWLTKPSQTARIHRPKSPSSSLPTPHSPLPISRLNSLEILPLFYALLGIGLRLEYFTPYTGFLILGAALTGVGVGQRHAEWKGISYLGIMGISIAWYELVIYQMLQASGGSPADGFTILALVAVAIAIVYRLFAWFWKSRNHTHLLNFTIAEITTIAHFHWGIGSVLILLAAITSIGTTPQLRLASIAISWMLALYALLQGRYPKQRNTKNSDQPHPPIPPSSSDSWVYLGLIEVAITGIYARLTWTQLSILDPWRVLFTCVVAIFLYQIPWWRWRWNVTPWQRYAIVSPLLTVLTIGLKGEIISDINILAIAAFYAWVAHRQSNLRWTYLSVLFMDWAVARWLENQQLTDPLWYPSLIGLSLLYIAQFDPELRMPQQRQTRHYLRLLGSGIICLVALFSHQETGLIPGIISIMAIFVGLGLRVRAFLFVGTATFLATGFYQLVVLSTRYPFSKGVIGLILGIVFISIAANFERRREQIIAVLQNWISQFQEWA